MSDLKIREAFDSDSVPLKNIALKKAHDRIEKLEAGEIEFDRIIGDYASENARFRDRIEKLEAALDDALQYVSRADWHYLKDETREALEGKDD